MRKVDRVLVCSLLNHESLFDLDYENVYSLQIPKEFFRILSKTQKNTSPVICDKGVAFCHRSCDEIILVLICKEGESLTATDKISLIQFTNRLIKVCIDFLGKLTVDNLLANITLFAEIIDSVLIGGFVHLTDTTKIRGFLSQSYTESKPHPSCLSASVNTANLSKLSGSGYQPSNQARVVPVTQSIYTPSATEDIYIDMIETLNFKINKTGETTCTVRGVLNSSNVSNGQKIVSFQLNKAYSKLVGDQSFSRFVNSHQFTTHGLLQASVPLGQTQLMSYQLTSPDPPFTLEASRGSSAGELVLTLHCTVPAPVMCLKVTVSFFLDQNSRGLLQLTKLASHTLELRADKQTIDWNIPEIAGQTYATVHFKMLPEGRDVEIINELNASLKFEIGNYLQSGCKLQAVKVDHSKKIKKWIRHLTVSDECKAEVLVK